jgi:hypothetical protein
MAWNGDNALNTDPISAEGFMFVLQKQKLLTLV